MIFQQPALKPGARLPGTPSASQALCIFPEFPEALRVPLWGLWCRSVHKLLLIRKRGPRQEVRQPNAIVHTLARAPVYSTLSSGKARTQNVKPHAGRPPLVVSPPLLHVLSYFFFCIFFPADSSSSLLHPRSLAPSLPLCLYSTSFSLSFPL